MQGALFGSGAPAFDARLPSLQRRLLSAGAWIEHHPGWLEGHERVFEQLRLEASWQSQRRQMYDREVEVPRLVARAPSQGPLADLLRRLSATLSERYRRSLRGASLDNISLAYYRDGNDSVAFHGDKVGRFANDTIVATVSVGAPRRFLLKPNLNIERNIERNTDRNTNRDGGHEPSAGGPSLAFDLGWGDLFVMGGSCQRTWLHAVPKRAHADPRISIMFRPPLPQG